MASGVQRDVGVRKGRRLTSAEKNDANETRQTDVDTATS